LETITRYIIIGSVKVTAQIH